MTRWATAPAVAALLVALLAGNVAATMLHRADLRPAYSKDGILTILVIGSDIGWPDRPGEELRGRADAIHLIAIDTHAKAATVVDFPRDTLVGGTKVNGHLSAGGPERLSAQMAAYTGLPIDFWTLTSFEGLRNMVGAVGGLEIDVERPMTSPDAGANLQPGRQRLDGPSALAFSRDRKSQPRGDFDRTRNQGRMLLAMHEQLLREHADLMSLTRLTAVFLSQTHTNIPRNELVLLGMLATQIPADRILHVPLGGSTGTTAGGSSIVHAAVGDTFDRIRAGTVGP